jgi:dienelactone hydrolase
VSRRGLIALALAGALVVLGATSVAAKTGGRVDRSRAAPYAGPGPYPAGVTTLDLGDRKVEVWYPVDTRRVGNATKDVYYVRATLPAALQAVLPASVNPPFTQDAYRDLPASTKGPFPLVLFAHGFAGFPAQSTFLTTHLAQWGFVVAAPDFLERDLASTLGAKPTHPLTDGEVVRATVKLLRQTSATASSLLAGTVKRGRFAITGHSAGGATAIAVGGGRDVATYIPLSAGGFALPGEQVIKPPATPSLYALGGDDHVAGTARVERYWKRKVRTPKRLVVIAGAGHTSPTDTCDIGNGGLVATARAYGLSLPASFDDLYDCKKAVVAHDTWPVYDHFVTAQLRFAFGINRRPVGLDERAARAFAPLKVSYRQILR